MDILIKIAQLILSLSILVILHELGHFIPARIFKTRVEKFYLFFDPYFSLFKIKRGDTEYGIGWLPLGGYVKISGMVDESMDKEQMALPPQPYEFRSKPAWQRLIIMIGGVTVNIILGMLIYAMVLFVWGKEYLPLKEAKYGIMTDSLGYDAGFRNGDRIQTVNGIVPLSIQEAKRISMLQTPGEVVVERDGKNVTIPISSDLAKIAVGTEFKSLFMEGVPVFVGSVQDTSKAYKAGLRKKDQIIAVDGKECFYFTDFRKESRKRKGKATNITILRGADTLVLNSVIDKDGAVGFKPMIKLDSLFTLKTQHYSFLESFPAGVNEALTTLADYARQFKLVFSKAGAKEVGGFASIADQFDPQWDWKKFWAFTGFLSIALAFMNILPIPALDGGHIMFLLYEMVSGRKPGEKFMERAQLVGMILLLSLLLFANGNDIYKWIFT